MRDILKVFPNYVELFDQTSKLYARTPEWRFILKWRLLSRMGRINKQYIKWFEEVMRDEKVSNSDSSS